MKKSKLKNKLFVILLVSNLVISVLNIAVTTSSDIKADERMEVYDKILLNKDTFSNGIRWHSEYESNYNAPEIYVDPVSSGLYIKAKGGVFINGEEVGSW